MAACQTRKVAIALTFKAESSLEGSFLLSFGVEVGHGQLVRCQYLLLDLSPVNTSIKHL